jgi:hypothetical protein
METFENNIKFRFAHLADCHIGGWREDELKKLSIKSFRKAINTIKDSEIEFLIIAGDLFNTSIPSIDALKEVALQMKLLKDKGIPIYIIAGSHDYSPSGKTMLDVLENAGLCKNVHKYKTNEKKLELTKHQLKNGEIINLTGIPGLAGGLERIKYKELSNREEIENLQGFKIFLFHTLLTELKPEKKEWEKISSESISLLPKNFNYYPGGHPHFSKQKSTTGYQLIAYPGPLFPNNFKELEELKHGGFYIADVYKDNSIKLNYMPVEIKKTLAININANEKSTEQVEIEIKNSLENQETKDKIITIRVAGTLKTGKSSDINFKKITEQVESYIILKNTTKLKSKEFSEIKIETGSIEEVEEAIIKENIGQIEIPDIQLNENQEIITNQLITTLDKEKLEGEKNIDFENRIIKDMIKIFNLENIFEK